MAPKGLAHATAQLIVSPHTAFMRTTVLWDFVRALHDAVIFSQGGETRENVSACIKKVAVEFAYKKADLARIRFVILRYL